jgi:tetratricopeptide (TPR) repeat protein
VETLNNFACFLAAWDEPALRDYELALRLAERACEITAWQDPEARATLALACNNLGPDLEARGEFGRAIGFYRKALEAKSDDEMPLLNLVMLLATCSDLTIRDADEAVQVAEMACAREGPRDPLRLAILAEACAAAGRFDEATIAADQAAQLAQSTGKTELAEELQRKARLYQKKVPGYKVDTPER